MERLAPAEIDTLSDEALNEYGAKLLGLVMRPWGVENSFAVSIDAQQAPGGPEEIGRSRGWWLLVQVEDDNVIVKAACNEMLWRLQSYDKPEARLRMEAWCLALQEGES